jgi:hypothetical protein
MSYDNTMMSIRQHSKGKDAATMNLKQRTGAGHISTKMNSRTVRVVVC